MRIAAPVQEGRLNPHFGRSPAFAFFDVDPGTRQITGPQILPAPPHDHGALAAFIKENGAAVVIAGGMGPGMRHALDREGITVVLGAPGIDPVEVVRQYQYLDGILVTADPGRGHDHGQGCCHRHAGEGR